MMSVHSQGQFYVISFVVDKRKCIIYWGTVHLILQCCGNCSLAAETNIGQSN
jgi:hypothetical protein